MIRLHSSTFAFTRLHFSSLVYHRRDSSGDLSTLAYIRLDWSNDLSTLVYIRLHSPRPVETRPVTRLCFKNKLFCEEYFSSIYLKVFVIYYWKGTEQTLLVNNNVQVNSPKSPETLEIKSVNKYVEKDQTVF